jgi:hypothetical protein
MNINKTKFCPSCKKKKSLSEYHSDKINGTRVYCKICICRKRKKYRENNKKKVYDYNKKYLAKDKNT